MTKFQDQLGPNDRLRRIEHDEWGVLYDDVVYYYSTEHAARVDAESDPKGTLMTRHVGAWEPHNG